MPTPSSGTISIQQINAEFGRGNNLNAYRGTTWFTPAGASGTFSSGAISMNEFYNKQPNSPTFSFTISSNQTNANLRTLAVNAGWNQSSAVNATISGGVIVYSTSTGTPALTINGSFPGGVTLVNNGTIQGMGGAGGTGRSYSSGAGGSAGAAGGLALSVSVAVSINNVNRIAGGGGGGGGGGSSSVPYGKGQIDTASGGGGGGGLGGGAGGLGGPISGFPYAGGNGTAGTLTTNGSGGIGGLNQNTSGRAGSGGNGGSYGSTGSAGANSTGTVGLGGGAAGGAVTGNGNISWIAFGTRNGGIS
jgi:hypothetical protein